MTDQDKEYLRDLFAGFALCGWIVNGDYSKEEMPSLAYAMADSMLEAREQKDVGIKAMRRRKTNK